MIEVVRQMFDNLTGCQRSIFFCVSFLFSCCLFARMFFFLPKRRIKMYVIQELTSTPMIVDATVAVAATVAMTTR